jgi:hypothetical protein
LPREVSGAAEVPALAFELLDEFGLEKGMRTELFVPYADRERCAAPNASAAAGDDEALIDGVVARDCSVIGALMAGAATSFFAGEVGNVSGASDMIASLSSAAGSVSVRDFASFSLASACWSAWAVWGVASLRVAGAGKVPDSSRRSSSGLMCGAVRRPGEFRVADVEVLLGDVNGCRDALRVPAAPVVLDD